MKDGKSGVEFFLSRLSWMIIIMMPIFAMFLELMNRPYYYVEHVIFSFHCHAFMFFLISLVFFINHQLLPAKLEGLQGALNGLVALYLLYYFYKAMRRVYKQGRIKTLLKYTFLLFSYFFTMTIAVMLTIVTSFFLF
jgi:preprotein translocase subunit SecG